MTWDSGHMVKNPLKNRKGQALVMAVVFMAGVLAMGALAVDLGLAFAARSGAQRAADAAALAGASAFIDFPQNSASVPAEARAYEYALSNDVVRRGIDSSQVEVWVIPDSQRVRVRISARDLPTWFARILGVSSMDVAALAAAEVSSGGSSDQCVLPFTIIDLWDENDPAEDPNGNNVPDEGEDWFLQDEKEGSDPDPYYPFGDPETTSGYPSPYGRSGGTGLGSAFRNNANEAYPVVGDLGRRIVIKTAPGQGGPATGGSEGGGWHPNHSGTVGPGNFQIWQMPDFYDDESCGDGTGGSSPKAIGENISGCNQCTISLGKEYPLIQGRKAALFKPLKDLYDQDSGARWSKSLNRVVGSSFGVDGDGGMGGEGGMSPLIRIAAIASPLQDFQGNKYPIKFNNFAYVFVEPDSPKDYVYIRFVGPIVGGGGPSTGPLVKYLRLIQ